MEPRHHHSTYRLAFLLSVPLLSSLLLFWLITRGRAELVLSWSILPNVCIIGVLVCFVLPVRRLSHTGRYRTLAILKRVCVGGLAEPAEGKFGDILMADVLTSYSKVLGDLFVALCMAINPKVQSTAKPDRNCGGKWIVPLLIAWPSAIRLRQCLIDFRRVRRNIRSGQGQGLGWGGQHLANALKYSTAFPVVILSALQRGYDPAKIGLTETQLFRLWYVIHGLCARVSLMLLRAFFVFVNSFYSFYWDVAKDWDLNLFSVLMQRTNSSSPNPSPLSPPAHYPWGLRRQRYFHSASIYYIVVGLDLLLRCTWSFKMSPHLDHFNDLEGGIFVMELLEVIRRWVWIFFRVETEWGEFRIIPRCAHHLTDSPVRNNPKGLAPDDVMLGDIDLSTGKYDED